MSINEKGLVHSNYLANYNEFIDCIKSKKVLKRLLELNHKIHAEEVAAGLWDKKKLAKKKEKATKATYPERDGTGGVVFRKGLL